MIYIFGCHIRYIFKVFIVILLFILKLFVSCAEQKKDYLSVAKHRTCGVNLEDIFLFHRLNGCN